MKVFVIGIAGGVGRRLAKALIAQGHQANGPVRRPEQIAALARNGVPSFQGDFLAMSTEEIAQAMSGSDAIVFTAGAGGKGGMAATTAIDGAGPGKLARAAGQAGIKRFVLVSVFPEAWRERHINENFEHYMAQKKRAEIDLVNSDLDWVILRPSALTNEPGTGLVDLGLAQIHNEIARDDVAATIVDLLETPKIGRIILEVTGGGTAIGVAVDALARSAAKA